MEKTYHEAECFVSINRKGTRAGELSYFIRDHADVISDAAVVILSGQNEIDAFYTEMTADKIRRLTEDTGI